MPGNDSFTKLLLHAEAADASTTFTDSSATARTMTANGNTQVDTAQSKFGGSSILFDGTGDWLSTADSADWFFDTSDFTVDFWVRINSFAADHGLWGIYQDANNRISCGLNTTQQLTFQVISGGTTRANYFNPSTNGMTTGTWYHVAYVRNGTAFAIYLNGVATSLTVGTAISGNSVPNFTTDFEIGRAYANGTINNNLNGWIDEFRVSKGIARWTTNFTPPAAPYAAEFTLTQTPVSNVAVAGVSTVLRLNRRLAAAVGNIAITGYNAALNYSPVSTYVLTAIPGNVVASGQPVALRAGRRMAAQVANVALVGRSVAMTFARGMIMVTRPNRRLTGQVVTTPRRLS